MKNPVMTIELDDHKIIQIELYPQYANNTIRSMIDLIQKGKLNHRPIQRIAYDFVLHLSNGNCQQDRNRETHNDLPEGDHNGVFKYSDEIPSC